MDTWPPQRSRDSTDSQRSKGRSGLGIDVCGRPKQSSCMVSDISSPSECAHIYLKPIVKKRPRKINSQLQKAISKRMRAVPQKDTPAEIRLQSALNTLNLRFGKHTRILGCSPDIVFSREQLAVFVDGDYWHGRLLVE